MKYLFTSLIFISANLFSFAQEFSQVVKQDIFGNPSDAQNQMYINMMNRSNELKKAEETSLYKEWQASEAVNGEEAVFEIDSANYNYSTDQFYFTHHKKLYYLNSEKVKSVKIGPDKFGTYTFQLKKENEKRIPTGFSGRRFPSIKKDLFKKDSGQ